jgi:hypothetical protein
LTTVELADDAWIAVLVIIDTRDQAGEDDHESALMEHAAEAIRKAVGL